MFQVSAIYIFLNDKKITKIVGGLSVKIRLNIQCLQNVN